MAERLKARVKRLRFKAPVKYVYNPLEYAWPVARAYYERYGQAPKEALFVGINPGPFGMGQTGVPFGEIAAVRDYLQLTGDVVAPRKTHSKRPVQGFECPRSEISGQRLWGAFMKKFTTAEEFFSKAFVINYCPLMFLDEKAVNVTPDKIKKEERQKMEKVCDKALAETIAVLQPKYVVGIGQYAQKRITLVTGEEAILMPHPSPANPKANKSWETDAKQALIDAGLTDYML
jgi:single-strand selective monofunctional uracil DNA glycosylase